MVELRDLQIIMNNPIDWNMFRDKTVLITGSTGRLGIYLADALIKADIDLNLNLRVILMARDEKKLKKIYGESLAFPNISTLIQDITQEIAIEDKVDYIFHTAGAASPVDFTTNPVGTLWGHIQGTRNVLEFARQNKSSKVLYVSTVEIYGNWSADENITEDDMGPIKCDIARSCYPEAKRMCETMLASYKEQYGIDYVTIRLCHTLGPGISLDDGRAFAQFIKAALKGEDIVLESDGSAMRTYTYVADAIGAMYIAFTKGTDSSYNVANIDNLISIRDLAEMIAGLDKTKRCKVTYASEKSGLSYLPFKLAIMDTTRIQELGWTPRVNCLNTFRYTIESF